MTAKLYGGGRRPWRRADKCDCGKIPYRDEAAALAAAALRAEEFDTPFRACKCPGTTRWHLATRGFHPRALRSRPRMLAWHMSVRRVIGWDGLLREFGLDPDADRGSSAVSKLSKTLRVFADLGLVSIDEPRP